MKERQRGYSRIDIPPVVNQTISGLVCGKPIRGNVAFWGVPYSSCLSQARFVETLKLEDHQVISPENVELCCFGAGI